MRPLHLEDSGFYCCCSGNNTSARQGKKKKEHSFASVAVREKVIPIHAVGARKSSVYDGGYVISQPHSYSNPFSHEMTPKESSPKTAHSCTAPRACATS